MKGPHTMELQLYGLLNRGNKLVHNSDVLRILGTFDGFYEGRCDIYFVEGQRCTSHSDRRENLSIHSRLARHGALQIVCLEGRNRFRNDLDLSISLLQKSFILLKKKNSLVFGAIVDHANIGFHVHIAPTHVKWDIFPLAYEAIGLIVSDRCEKMSS